MSFDFVETIGSLNEPRKTCFYELLAYFLTVSMRGILFSEGIPDDERVERAKWLNEVAHRITYKTFVLQKSGAGYSEEEIWNMIRQNAKKHPITFEDLTLAIEMSYRYILDNESDSTEAIAA
jgi:hypothetical protein